MIIAIDFDGTIVKHEFPAIGDEVPGAVETIKNLQNAGNRIILYTMRSGKYLRAAVDWCKEKDLVFWAVNENPEQKLWTSSPKIYAGLYIDDAAYGVPLVKEKEGRPYVDWSNLINSISGVVEEKILGLDPNEY